VIGIGRVNVSRQLVSTRLNASWLQEPLRSLTRVTRIKSYSSYGPSAVGTSGAVVSVKRHPPVHYKTVMPPGILQAKCQRATQAIFSSCCAYRSNPCLIRMDDQTAPSYVAMVLSCKLTENFIRFLFYLLHHYHYSFAFSFGGMLIRHCGPVARALLRFFWASKLP